MSSKLNLTLIFLGSIDIFALCTYVQNITLSALNRDVVGEGLGLYYELDLLEALELACGSLEIE